MAVIHPWVLPLTAALVLLALLTGGLLARTRPSAGATRLAFTERFRALPSYRRRARRLLRWTIVELLGLVLTCAGAGLVAARVVETVPTPEERRNRDVVLCLDVSGSMVAVDQAIIDVFTDLAGRLDGERIGLMLFDSSAVTVFPLTDDADFVADQLERAREEVGEPSIAGTNLGEGSSLIGDGLTSCLARFDAPDARRSRTIVLATDNQVAGDPLYTVEQAVDLAVEREVMVYAIAPSDNSPTMTARLRQQAQRTDGTVALLNPRAGTDVAGIHRAIEAQERIAMAGRPRPVVRDRVWPGALLGLAGLALAGVARAVRRHR